MRRTCAALTLARLPEGMAYNPERKVEADKAGIAALIMILPFVVFEVLQRRNLATQLLGDAGSFQEQMIDYVTYAMVVATIVLYFVYGVPAIGAPHMSAMSLTIFLLAIKWATYMAALDHIGFLRGTRTLLSAVLPRYGAAVCHDAAAVAVVMYSSGGGGWLKMVVRCVLLLRHFLILTLLMCIVFSLSFMLLLPSIHRHTDGDVDVGSLDDSFQTAVYTVYRLALLSSFTDDEYSPQ
ncbi:hypothetical protein T484DRAFT_1833105, partial [Baffinella frigidus]